jgi:hypothetical protein
MELLTIFDYIGFVGVFILVFTLTKLNLITDYSEKYEFYYCNIFGSILLMISDFYRDSWYSLGIGAFWIAISTLTVLNNLKLPNKQLIITLSLAILFFFSGLMHSIFYIENINEKIFKSLGMLSTLFCVILYGCIASKNINIFQYLLTGVILKTIMLFALYNDFNMASFSLQLYSITIAIFGMLKIKYKLTIN